MCIANNAEAGDAHRGDNRSSCDDTFQLLIHHVAFRCVPGGSEHEDDLDVPW
jgi:hypothetical protein